jgi:hypothetical protein
MCLLLMPRKFLLTVALGSCCLSPDATCENKAEMCRITCGWPLRHLDLAQVCRFWRDVHSPAIARRAGIYEYRHMQYAPVRSNLFAAVDGITTTAPANAQLRWMSDVRYRDQAGLDLFGTDPGAEVKRLMLSDIDMIVDRSTTYLALGPNAHTLKDESGDPAPLGPVKAPTFSLFLRTSGEQWSSRAALTALAQEWAALPDVIRIRLSLFEIPDMEAERKAGYPVKTHPPEQQYQAWIDLTVADEETCRTMIPSGLAEHVSDIHAYPAHVVHTFNYGGRPTLAGLRGYSAVEAIGFLDAKQHRDPALLDWMYGPVTAGGPVR